MSESENNFYKKCGEFIAEAAEAMKDSKSIFLCPNCAHKNVCKNVENKGQECQDFMDASTYRQYPSIYNFFEPIFNWIKFHYPAGEVKFIVDHNSARMIQEHGPAVFSKEIKEPLSAEKIMRLENEKDE